MEIGQYKWLVCVCVIAAKIIDIKIADIYWTTDIYTRDLDWRIWTFRTLAQVTYYLIITILCHRTMPLLSTNWIVRLLLCIEIWFEVRLRFVLTEHINDNTIWLSAYTRIYCSSLKLLDTFWLNLILEVHTKFFFWV